VQFAGQNNTIPAKVISAYYRDPKQGDIAFLRLESIPENTIPLRVGAAEHSRSGSSLRAFGYSKVGELEGVHARGEILGLVKENGQLLLQLRSQELNLGHSGAPVWDEKRGVVVGMIVSVYKSSTAGKLRDTAFAVPSETLWQVCPEIRPSEICPYLGLEPFTDKTAQFFFGREAFTEKMLDVLQGGNRFLAVFGPSGSGKSSVVRAGLLLALKNGRLPNSQKWAQITTRPADNPFEQMKAAGLDLIELPAYFRSHTDAERVFLFIDQFEELFTLCSDDLRNQFVKRLKNAINDPRLLLIISMRDDFYSIFNAKAAELARSEQIKIENIPGMLNHDELASMIEQPADMVGLSFEEGLTELIIKDLSRAGEIRSSMLPLMEFVLEQLWERRRDGLLTHEAYKAIGGVTGSLPRWADDAYSVLSRADQLRAERLFTSLVSLGDDSRGLPDTRRSRLLESFDISSKRVIQYFTDKRLITTNGQMIEINGELIQQWDLLKVWIKKEHDNIRLKEVAKQSKLSKSNKDRFDNSLIEAKIQKKSLFGNRLVVLGSLSTTFLVLIFALILTIYSRNQNQQILTRQVATLEAAKATITSSRHQIDSQQDQIKSFGLANDAMAILNSTEGNVETAMLICIRSLGITYNEQADESLLLGMDRLYAQRILVGHTEKVNAVAVSPNGQIIATGGNDDVIRLWDFRTGKSLNILAGHESHVNGIAFSKDGTRIASASSDRTVRLWDTNTGKELHALIGHSNVVTKVYFSPSEESLLSVGDDKTIKIWDVKTGNELNTLTLDTFVDVAAFSPDGKTIGIGCEDNVIRLLDYESLTETREFKGHADWIVAMAFSSDGNRLLTGSFDKTARIWDVNTGKQLILLSGHTAFLSSVAFFPDGKKVVTGSYDTTARLWDAITGGQLITFSGHTGSVMDVAVSPDGNNIVTGSADTTTRIWQLTSKAANYSMNLPFGIVRAALSQDKDLILIADSDGSVQLWNMKTKQEIRVFNKYIGNVHILAFSPNVKSFLTDCDNFNVCQWNLATGDLEHIYQGHTDTVSDAIYSPNGNKVLTTSYDNSIKLWDANSEDLLHTFSVPDVARAISFSPEGDEILVGSDNKIIYLVDLASYDTLWSYEESSGPIRDATFSPDGKTILFGSSEGFLRLLDRYTGELLSEYFAGYTAVSSIAISSDNQYILAGFQDHTVRLWGASSTNKLLRTFRIHQAPIVEVAFTKDGKHIFTSSLDGNIRLLNIDYRQLLELSCSLLLRDLTYEQRIQYDIMDDNLSLLCGEFCEDKSLPNHGFHPTCPQWSLGSRPDFIIPEP